MQARAWVKLTLLMPCRYSGNMSPPTTYSPPVTPISFGQSRADRHRLPGWTKELVIRHGLGTLSEAGGNQHVVRLDGRASGPVFFNMSDDEISRWREGKRLAQVLGF